MIDADAVRQNTDLLALIGRNTLLHKVAGTCGGEYAGACPFCGGVDRLRVQPDRGRWWCRHCLGRWEDAIAYVRRRDHVSFRDACHILAGSVGSFPSQAPVSRARPTLAAQVESEPSRAWQMSAEQFIARSEDALWAHGGAAALDYLHARGLHDQTLRFWRIGLNRFTSWHDSTRWGMSTDQAPSGRIWLPEGVVIPWLIAGQPWQIKVRRFQEPDPKRRYLSVAGGHPALFGADTLVGHNIAVMTEGELDCVLAWQEANDLLGTCTLGSCSKSLGTVALRHLLPMRRIFLAYDNDIDGEKGAVRLAQASARFQQIKLPTGKDVSDFHRRGGRIREWLEATTGTGEP